MTFTAYDAVHDKPAVVTNAQGFTSCYKYDSRGRKIAEWGTALQPACFGYDDRDNMVSLSTFRAGDETITTDPSERTDKDTTTWIFHPLTGAELSKTYADNTSVTKTYDAYNRLATETDARGNVKTHSYEPLRGLHIGTTYSDGTTARSYTYNHLGQPTQVTDDSGTRTFGYNSYGERISDSLSIDSDTHLITESLDAMGRSTGFVYSKNGTAQHTVTTGYSTDGRINSAGFLHGGAEKVFGYEYLSGSNLLHRLTKPNGMTLTQSYEIQRDLLTGVAYHRGTTLVANRQYSYDTLGRPTARNTARKGTVVNDTFAHNTRSELTAAQVNGEDYQYNYDNIGNRTTATEGDESTTYTANALNQYTAIQENAEAAFTPQFDADGNQTHIKTETDIWEVIYNAENRPVSFTNTESNTVVECAYDSMGRRAYKKVTVNGNITLHQRYIYRGYLQIAALDLTRSNHPALWLITWDPTQPIATRPLSIRINGTWYTYGWDLTKNICELYSTGGGIATSYTYTPFGKVTSSGSITQPIQWSSEFHDTELGLVYYNYRYYNQNDRRWIRRDPVSKLYDYNVYALLKNKVYISDYLGLTPACVAGALAVMGRALLGASVGLAIRALGDLVEQELSTKREYLAAMVGGMIGGLIGNLHIGIIGGEIAESLIENYGNENIDYCSISMELISGISLSYIGSKFKIMPNIDEKLHKLIVGGVEEVHSVFIINIKREIKRIGIKTDKLSSIIYKEVKRSYRELTQEMLPTFTESLMSFFSGLNERINFNEDKHTNFDYGNIKFKGKVDIEADNEKYSDEIKSENYFMFPTNEK